MSKYTTGELAKLCGVTVRTVQYYDSRGILIPTELSEGGRRLYTDDDVRRLKIICFLRDMGLPIDTVSWGSMLSLSVFIIWQCRDDLLTRRIHLVFHIIK